MKIKLTPDKDMGIRKIHVQNLKRAGVEAVVDVYHTDMHAFDMLRDDDLSREATGKFEQHFARAGKECVRGRF